MNSRQLLYVMHGISYSGFAEAFESQETGIAVAAGETSGRGIVTAVGKRKIHAEVDGFADDFRFGKFDQRCVNLKPSAFDTGFGSEIGQVLERFDKFRSAIGIAAVVDGVYAKEDVVSWNHFGPRKRVRQEYCVSCGNVGDWNAVRDFCFRSLFRHFDGIRKRRAGEDAQVDLCGAMLFCA